MFETEAIFRKCKIFFFRGDALRKMEDAVTSGQQQWMKFANETYIKEAGWYFKTLAVQEIGKGTVFEVVMVNSRIND